MLPREVLNRTIASRVGFMAAGLCAEGSMNSLGFWCNACQKMGTALFPMFHSWYASILFLSSNILSRKVSRPSHSRKLLMYSLSSASSLLEL
jgi:hypothetical protein